MPDETIADRLNRAYHRLISRIISKNDGVLGQATVVTDAWLRNNPYPPAFVAEWKALLSGPRWALRQAISRRDALGERLRGTSPFLLTPSIIWSKETVVRLWRLIAYHAMRILEPCEYATYTEHLKKLSRKDRMSRFGRIVDDGWIERFVQGLTKDPSTIILGHFSPSLELDGAIQVSVVDRKGVRYVDLGLSVMEETRHRGLGGHLLERALIWARMHGAERVVSLCAANNVEVQRMGRERSVSTSLLHGSYEAPLDLSPLTVSALANDILEEFTGEYDYETKAHRTAFSFIAGNGSMHPIREKEFIQLVKIATVGRTDVLAQYLVLFRFALARYEMGAAEIVGLLANIKDTLEPLVTHDPDLRTYVAGLPSVCDAAAGTQSTTRISS